MDGCGVGGRARRIGRIIRSARLSGLLVGIRRGHAIVGDVLGPLGSVPVAVLMSAGGIRLPTCGVVGHLRWSCPGSLGVTGSAAERGGVDLALFDGGERGRAECLAELLGWFLCGEVAVVQLSGADLLDVTPAEPVGLLAD